MVPAIFLLCALAEPSTQFHPTLDHDDIKVVKMLVDHDPFDGPNHRVLLIGTSEKWVWTLRQAGFMAWRLTMTDHAYYDIKGSLFKQPIIPETLKMVVYLFQEPAHLLNIQKAVMECTQNLEVNGLFVFDEGLAPNFKNYLPANKFTRLPLRWHNMLIFQKLLGGSTDGTKRKVRTALPIYQMDPRRFNRSYWGVVRRAA